MTKPLEQMTVEELLQDNHWVEDWIAVADELARRLADRDEQIERMKPVMDGVRIYMEGLSMQPLLDAWGKYEEGE